MSNSVRRICVVTGSRAEYGLLRWIITEIKNHPKLSLDLIVTGTHLSPSFGSTVSEIAADGHTDFKKVHLLIDGDDNASMSKSIGLGIISMTDALVDLAPDVVLVLGDRFEILAATIAAYTLQIPVAHIHGGEKTGGALDEGYRHSITKMSALHFVAAKDYARRVTQLGENPKNVFMVGAPGLEGIQRATPVSLNELSKKIGLVVEAKKYVVVAYHPETANIHDGFIEFKALLDVLETIKDRYQILFSKSNADAGGRAIGKMIDDFTSKHPKSSAWFSSLGHAGFTSLLKNSTMLIGNSSSGIIEAPALKIPSINIGTRQSGRLFASSVIQTNGSEFEILAALKLAENIGQISFANLPYGTGTGVASEIVRILTTVTLTDAIKKEFYDLDKEAL